MTFQKLLLAVYSQRQDNFKYPEWHLPHECLDAQLSDSLQPFGLEPTRLL